VEQGSVKMLYNATELRHNFGLVTGNSLACMTTHGALLPPAVDEPDKPKNRLPKGNEMAHYLIQSGYTADAWNKLVKNPEDRTEAIRPVIEKLGGKLEGSWFAFGEHDLVLIVQMPDNVSAAAFALAAAAGGALRSFKTTPLLEYSEGLAALKLASKSGYRPPGK
jgi:uncharacterized protein with GYD domain